MDLFLENDIAVILEPLEHSITDVLIPAFIEHAVTEVECDLLAHSMHLGGFRPSKSFWRSNLSV